MIRLALPALILLMTVSIGTVVLSNEEVTTEEIRARISAIGVRSVQSSTGHLVVSGPDPFGNAMLLSLAGETADAVESITGNPLPFSRQSVRILVLPPSPAARANAVELDHTFLNDFRIHRIVLADYAVMETEAAAEVLCAAFLSVYLGARSDAPDHSSLPVWLRRGMVRILTADNRQATIESALRLWRQGLLPPPARILALVASDDGPGGSEDEAVACGSFMLWFTGLPEKSSRFSLLFRRLSEGGRTDPDWMQEWLPGAGDPDEQRDRWLLAQRTVVRGVGTVSLEHLDALYAEWLVHPGQCDIPNNTDLPEMADCTSLAAYRDEPWFTMAVRGKRLRIEMLAQGRPRRFQLVVAAYVESLNALERGEPMESVIALAGAARRQWLALRDIVGKAGGVWSDP